VADSRFRKERVVMARIRNRVQSLMGIRT
jgi:hypothetical protein